MTKIHENWARVQKRQEEIAAEIECSRGNIPVLAPLEEEPNAGMMDVSMDPQLWGNLHRHVGLEKVFTKLPFRKFFQARLVCKEWNRLASDEKFLEESYVGQGVFPRLHFCLMHPTGDWQIILTSDEGTDEWRQMPMTLPYSKGSRANWVDGFLLISSLHDNAGKDDLGSWVKNVVINFRTRMQHILPPQYIEECLVVYECVDGLVVKNCRETFQVVSGVMDEFDAWHTSIYCSKTKAWTFIKGRCHRHPRCDLNFRARCFVSKNFSSSVCSRNILYTYSRSPQAQDQNIIGQIVLYDLTLRKWSELAVPCGDHCHLCVWQENVYAVSSKFDPGASYVRVHRLRQPETVWEEVASAPQVLSRQLFETNDLDLGMRCREIPCVFQAMHVEASFCEQYVHIAVFLQDYHVDSRKTLPRFRIPGRWVPRRFCLYNLATREWKYVKRPFNTGRERIEEQWS